jgi:hypothetical protein
MYHWQTLGVIEVLTSKVSTVSESSSSKPTLRSETQEQCRSRLCRIEVEDVVFAVNEGTGEYRTARGQATFEYEERENRIVITYELET